jgi:hypothetical protein
VFWMRSSRIKAGELPGLSERHLRDAYEGRGEEGLVARTSEFVSGSRRGSGGLAEAFRDALFRF